MIDHTEIRRRSWLAGGAIALLAAIFAFVVWDGVTRSRQLLRLSGSYGETVDTPEIVPGSPTGYASGRRSMLLSGGATDGHHWIMHTQMMTATGEWRVRHVDYDNAPEGREMHWASPFRWWLAALAWVDHAVSARPIGVSVERAALISGPVMFGFVALGMIVFLRRTSSLVVAALIIGSMVAVRPFYLDYMAGRPDHHGLVNLCCMFTAWPLLLGSRVAGRLNEVPPVTGGAARPWFVGSALAGGMGLWISASTQVPVLVGTGIGVLVAGWIGRGATTRIAWLIDPNLFRLWGRVGAIASLAAYLIEYFPRHLGMRLEVNHPLYGLAWLGAGEVLRLYARGLQAGWRRLGRREWIIGAIGAGAVMLLPLVIAIGGARVFLVSDPLLWRLSTRHVAEAQGLWSVLAGLDSPVTWLAMTLPIVWLILPVVLVWRAGLAREWLALLALVWVPAVLTWALGVGQVRWLGLAWAMTAPLIGVFFLVVKVRFGVQPMRAGAWGVAAGLLLAPGAVHAVRQSLISDEPTTEDIQHLAERDLAHWLRLRTDGRPAVVATTPGAATWMAAYGGVRVLGKLYWDNTERLKKTAELFAAPTAEVARELVRRWGVTHVVCVSWYAFESVLVKEARGLPVDAPIPTDAFIVRLLAAPVPERWLRAIPFTLPKHDALAGAQIRIWEVVDEQTPAEALAHAANFFLESGRADDAARLAPALSRVSDDLNAAVMVAAIASSQRDTGAFLQGIDRVSALLTQVDRLALDDHVHLVVVLAVAQRPDLARTHLLSCMRQATAETVRTLTPGTLSDLLALSDALQVPFPDPETQRLAKSLLPPARRN